ncbi:hypothetical protein ABZ490_49960 [Streptomyces sp. NPDC005811]|uniref:hypothetical protein n=1 Tax=Streptomyces sp. NPDC005811 TaxID=3154565 RepID=UPI0033DF7F65
MDALLGVGTADAQAVDLDKTADLQTQHRLPYGRTRGIARLFGAVDDARKTGDRRGQRGAVDGAAPAGLSAHVRQHGPLHPPESS